MAALKIMLIRHAEKPTAADAGVSPTGLQGPKDLTVRGWQRAGALVCYFAPPSGAFQDARIATPQSLFASHSSSSRPRETLLPLSQKLGIAIDVSYGKGGEERLVAAAKECAGVALISWQHDFMAAIANSILGDNRTAPPQWPKERFDLVWVFDLIAATGKYAFAQVPQLLLAGDSVEPIR
jgi:hypothetical protein